VNSSLSPRERAGVGGNSASLSSGIPISRPPPTPMASPMPYSSLRELYVTRLREFYRQPARIFWVYGFPTVLACLLGLAFRSRPAASLEVDVVENAAAGPVVEALNRPDARPRSEGQPAVRPRLVPAEVGEMRIKTGKTPVLVIPGTGDRLTYRFDPTRPEAIAARDAFDDAYQRARGRTDPVATADSPVKEPGSRYIDFLIPGLIGVNTMGGGLWGVGFLIVNFRIAKLLKRFMATPMPRRNFLLAILGARLTFLIPDVAVLMLLGVLGFGMPVRGSLAVLALVEVAGALAFAGIGLLVASRAATTETVSGLMNLVMIPMWIFSGVFFSSDRFPAGLQPLIRVLPLTQLVSGLRAVLLEGAGLVDVAGNLLILSAWAVVTFLLALRLFRWT